eukprot:11646264-Prorocentrum_lima.AAC.1
MGIFSVIIGKVVDAIAEQFPNAIITAYADDIIVVCDAKDANSMFNWTHFRVQQHGIALHLDKTEIWKAQPTS